MISLRPSQIWKKIVRQPDWLSGFLGRRGLQRPGSDKGALKIETTAEEVEEAARVLGDRFLATGNDLEKVTAKGELFIQLSTKMLTSATGKGDGSSLFFESMGTVETPLNFLSLSHEKTVELLLHLRQANDRINEFGNIQADLQRTIAPLKYLQTLFKIESAPMGANVQTMFGALTQEIEALHDQMCELFTTKFLELKEINGIIYGVITELQARTDILGKSIQEERANIERSLSKLQQELAENKSREPRISGLGKAVNNEIIQVVIALQYQDIINQKLQHTVTSLTQIHELCRSGSDNKLLAQSCQLEAHQIQATRKDLAKAEQSVKTGVQNILNQLRLADSKCVSLEEFRELTTSADGMVQVILDALETLRHLIADSVTHSVTAFEKLRPIRGLASDVSAVVRELSQRIHLIGLNAQLRAAQVDQGFGLEVLSARTSEISRETICISETVATHLDELVRSLAGAVIQLEKLQGDALEQKEILDREGKITEHKMHGVRDETLATLNRVFSLLEELQSESESLITRADYVSAADEALAKLEKEFLATAESAALLAGADPSQPPSSQLQESDKVYTMASEREIFDRVVKGQASAPSSASPSDAELFDSTPSSEPVPRAESFSDPTPADAAAGPAKPNGADLGFDFFDAPPSADAVAATPKPEVPPAPKKDAFPMPDPPPVSGKIPPSPAPPPTPPANFGDNVELF